MIHHLVFNYERYGYNKLYVYTAKRIKTRLVLYFPTPKEYTSMYSQHFACLQHWPSSHYFLRIFYVSTKCTCILMEFKICIVFPFATFSFVSTSSITTRPSPTHILLLFQATYRPLTHNLLHFSRYKHSFFIILLYSTSLSTT